MEKYDKKGYDKDGYNIRGYNKDGYNRDGYDRNGYDIDGFDSSGYDEYGFDKNGIHRETKSKYDTNGYDKDGFDCNGYDVDGYNIEGYDKNGFDKEGWNKDGLDKFGNSWDELYQKFFEKMKLIKEGYKYLDYENNIKVSKKSAETEYGFKLYGCCNKYTGTRYDERGIDKQGYNKKGFKEDSLIHDNLYTNRETGTKYDKNGYDINGYDTNGFNKKGIYKDTGTIYNKYGYDVDGYNIKGWTKEGIYYKTGTKYNENGYDKDGYDQNGFNKDGLNKKGKSAQEVKETKDKQRNNFLGLLDVAEKLGTGAISMDQYMMRTKMSIDELIEFAKKQNLSAKVIRGLYGKKKDYAQYSKKFNPKEYLEHTTLFINEQEIKPTKEDVDKCIEYLKENGRYICDKTVRETIRDYYIIISFDGQRYMIFPIFAPQIVGECVICRRK